MRYLRDQREYRVTDYTHSGYLQKLNLSLRKYTARRRNIQYYYSFYRLLTLKKMILETQTNGVSRKTVGGCFKSKQLALELYRGSAGRSAGRQKNKAWL